MSIWKKEYTILRAIDIDKQHMVSEFPAILPEKLTSFRIEPAHDKTYKMACAPSEDSDQPVHPPSLISLRCLHEECSGPWLPIERTAKTDQTGRMHRLI